MNDAQKREPVTLICVLEQQRYRPGDQAPTGYLEWHEWAEVQHKAGLRQKQCGRCGLWRFPQQLSAQVDRKELAGMRKRKPTLTVVETPVCKSCASAEIGRQMQSAEGAGEMER